MSDEVSPFHTPPDDIKRVCQWYQKAQVDYVELFLKMYIAYNAWYRGVTGTTNDRQAIGVLKKRYVIWDDYRNGHVMKGMARYMERLVELTQREPLISVSIHWTGQVEDIYDWRSLIEYWYQVRCLIAHGAEVNMRYAWLAYETLDIFMGEILNRVKVQLESHNTKNTTEFKELHQLSMAASSSKRFKQLQNKLYLKYIAAPDVWQVDMQRVLESPE